MCGKWVCVAQLATSYTTLFLQNCLPMTAIQADDHTYVCLAHSELRTRKCVACLSVSWFGHGEAWYTLTFCRRMSSDQACGRYSGDSPERGTWRDSLRSVKECGVRVKKGTSDAFSERKHWTCSQWREVISFLSRLSIYMPKFLCWSWLEKSGFSGGYARIAPHCMTLCGPFFKTSDNVCVSCREHWKFGMMAPFTTRGTDWYPPRVTSTRVASEENLTRAINNAVGDLMTAKNHHYYASATHQRASAGLCIVESHLACTGHTDFHRTIKPQKWVVRH